MVIKLIIIGIIAVTVLSMMGIGAGFIEDLGDYAKEQVASKADQDAPDPSTVGNTIENNQGTGKRVCNVKIELVGSATGIILSDKVKLWNGVPSGGGDFFAGVPTPDHDPAVIHYQWFCKGEASPLSLLGFVFEDNFRKFGQTLALTETKNDITIRFHVTGESKSNGLELTGTERENSTTQLLKFSGKQDFGSGISFPLEFNIPIYIYNVVEDNYILDYWTQEFELNDRNPGHHFKYTMCKSGLSSC